MARDADLRALLDSLDDLTTGSGPRFRRLARSVSSAVERGVLAHGVRLPSERMLAAALAVSRGTVVAAYDLLVAEGLIERRRGSGTYVVGDDGLVLPPGREGSALVHRLVDRSAGPSDVVDLSLSVLDDAAGLPHVGVSVDDLLDVTPPTGYTPWGLAGLRDRLARHVTGWGLPTRPEQIVVTSGAQQALSAAAACWVRAGDTVAVDDPTYPGAVAAFTQAGAELVPLRVDSGGVRVDAVARALERRPALLYLQSGPHSPTGAVLSDPRRRAIASMVREQRVPLVEDAALVDLAWDELPAPVATWCGDAATAVIGSLGKLFWGGLRLGFVRAPEPVALRFARVKATHDLGSSAVAQVLAERLLDEVGTRAGAGAGTAPGPRPGAGSRAGPAAVCGDGGFREWRRGQLRERYHHLAAELRARLPEWEWADPQGGLSVWVRLPGGSDAEAFARTASEHGVAVAAPGPLSCTGGQGDHIRLSFSADPATLTEGVTRLAATWHTVTGGP